MTNHVVGRMRVSPIPQSEYARWSESLPRDYPQVADYRRVLLRWVVGAERYWKADPEHPRSGKCRLPVKKRGRVTTHITTARALPVYAALAADPECNDFVWTRDKLAERLNGAIAFLCATYDPDGPREGCWAKKPWANSLRYETWVIGNMLDVVQIVPDLVTPDNKRRVRDILVDIVEDERVSGRARKLEDYRHEGITWTINLLARGAILYPDHPKAKQWLDLAKHGYASSLSVHADLKDETVVDGRPIMRWVARRCPVFHPDFTLTHHGLGIHPGYMAIAAHRMVSLYDLMKRRDAPISRLWHHRLRDMMGVIKGLALWDGRIAFPNGKDWCDYLYGVMDVLFDVVGLQLMFGDREARLIEQGVFRHLEWLQLNRGRGDFGPSDAEYVFNVNDAKSVGFAYWLHQAHGVARPATQAQLDRAYTRVLHSPYCKFVCVRDPARFASWGWQACKGRTTGLIVPRGHGLGDHLAQWDDSLIPDYWTVDARGRRRPLRAKPGTRQVETFRGGFAVSERTELSLLSPANAADAASSIVDHRAMVAIPDGRTVLFAASGRAMRAVRQLAGMDINWRFVRSVFSDMGRTIFHARGQSECRNVSNVRTPWFNIDGIMGIVPIGRQAQVSCEPFGEVDKDGIPLAELDPFGAHAGQTVRLGVCSLAPRDYEAGQEVFTACVAFVTDVEAAETERLVDACSEDEPRDAASVYSVRGQDGKQYVVAVNFTDSEAHVPLTGLGAGRLFTPEAAQLTRATGKDARLRLARRGCALLAAQPTHR